MAGQFCTKCGGQNPPGAAYCQYCGSPMAAGAGAPLAGGAGVPPPMAPMRPGPPGYQPYNQAPQAPPPRRPSIGRIIVIIVVVVLIIGILAYLLLPVNQPTVNVTLIQFVSSDNTCGLNGVQYEGFSTNTSQPVDLYFSMNNSNTTHAQCTIHTVGTNNSGFSITGVTPLPLVIPANASEQWNFTVNVPGNSWTGVLYVFVT